MQTLSQFLAAQTAAAFPHELCRLVHDIACAAKAISRDLSRSWINGLDGCAGSDNIHGEQQKTMDKVANRHFRRFLAEGGLCGIYISEEEPGYITLGQPAQRSPYVVALDPLDGSSNMGLNLPIGSIFSVYRFDSAAAAEDDRSILQKGRTQLAAGYFLYGPATMLILACSGTVNGFTLESSGGEFLRSHPNIRIPGQGPFYALNEGQSAEFPEGLQTFLAQLKAGLQHPCSSRYSGSMVADVHRILFRGGLFLYPGTETWPEGKLRLVYENSPMAFIIEMAGGAATDGYRPILDIRPGSIHERCPVYLGSADLVRSLYHTLNQQHANFI